MSQSNTEKLDDCESMLRQNQADRLKLVLNRHALSNKDMASKWKILQKEEEYLLKLKKKLKVAILVNP